MPNRRRFLRVLGTVGAAGFAGCASSGEPTQVTIADSGDDDSSGDTSTATQSGTPTASANATETTGPTQATATETATPTSPVGDPSTWPMYAFDAGNAGVTSAVGPTDTPTVRWVESVTDGTVVGPTYANDTIYVGANDGVVVALNPLSGYTRWTRSLGKPVVGYPASDGAALYVATETSLYSLDAATGKPRWSLSGAFADSNPTVSGDQVFIGTADGQVLAVRKADGTTVWSHDHGSPITSTPAVDDDVVLFGGKDGIFNGLDRTTGTVQWTEWSNGAVFGSPSIGGSQVYLGNDQGTTYARNKVTGSGGWTVETFTQIKTSPAVDGTTVVATDRNGTVAALDPDTGTERWRTELDRSTSDPVIASDDVYVGAGPVYALDPDTGSVRWSYDPPGKSFLAPPVPVDENLVAIDTDGSVHFLESPA